MKKLVLGTLAIASVAATLLGQPFATRAAPLNGTELANGAQPGRKAAVATGHVDAAGLSLAGVVLPDAQER